MENELQGNVFFKPDENGELKRVEFAYTRTVEQQKAYEKQKALQKEQQEKEMMIGVRDFTFSDTDGYKKLMEEIAMNDTSLTVRQAGYFYLLTTYIDYDGFIRKTAKQEPITLNKEIRELIDVKTNRTVKQLIDALEENDLLRRETFVSEDGTEKLGFKLNPAYSFKGERNGERTVKTFSKAVREIYEYNGVEGVSFIVPLLPYISIIDNVISANPFETDAGKLKPLNQTEIAEITGFSRSKVKRQIKNLKYKDMHVIAPHGTGWNKLYMVNPEAVYRGKGEPQNALVRLFKINKDN